jgi:hypothetical protein
MGDCRKRSCVPISINAIITMPAPAYIISRAVDPIFAVLIGLGAAGVRINREQKEKGKTMDQAFQDGLRYASSKVDVCRACLS